MLGHFSVAKRGHATVTAGRQRDVIGSANVPPIRGGRWFWRVGAEQADVLDHARETQPGGRGPFRPWIARLRGADCGMGSDRNAWPGSANRF